MFGAMCCKFRSCCGCCALRVGVVIIGVLQLVLSALALSGVVMELLAIRSYNEAKRKQQQEAPPSPAAPTHDETEFVGVYEVIIVLNILNIIFNATLLHGARKRKAGFLQPWLWYNIIMAVIVAIFDFVIIYLLGTQRMHYKNGIGTLLVVQLLYIILISYFISVVKSFHRELLTYADAIGNAS